ncbi:MAG TPA: hypothetical protein VIF38_00705 [Burkholderiales bacterium]
MSWITVATAWLGMSYGTRMASVISGSTPSFTSGGNRREVTDGELILKESAVGLPPASSPADICVRLIGR